MKKLVLLLTIALCFAQLSAQKKAIWKKITPESVQQLQLIRTTSYSERQQLFQVDVNQLQQELANAIDKFSGNSGIIVEFPNSEGDLEIFQVWENSNFASELQAKYPEIRAYIGTSLSDKTAVINFSLSPIGIQTMVLRADSGSEYIEPYTTDHTVYVLFDSKTRTTGKLPFTCSTVDKALNQEIINNPTLVNRSSNLSYKTMRLALSCVGEYGAYYGGTVGGALAGMNATMTRVNGVLEKDLALHLNMIANNNLVVYTNGSTDPYSAAAAGSGGAWNQELQTNLTAVLGNSVYDIGHLFGASGGGGNAGCIGCVCIDPTGAASLQKGSGFTSPSNNIPAGDTFDIDYVVHEMGHQLGGNHSFSHNNEGSGVQVEPGSGSTIMGYAGITSYDVQAHSDAYFCFANIKQIQTNLAGKTCPISTPITTNTPPSISFPITDPASSTSQATDFTIPKGTPFVLRGVATDAEGDGLTYCWEQNNSATTASSGASSVASPTKTTGPNYRSFSPVATPNRFFPAFANVLAGTLSTQWESVNTAARASSIYAFTVRDNHPGNAQQTNTRTAKIVTSGTAGPFAVTSQATVGTTWAVGTSQTITWDVNNTNTLPGSANVTIKLSLDGGTTFPYILAENTANDGSETIVVPETPASLNCRIWIEPTANVYYAINSKPFYIGYSVVTNCTTYTYNTPFALPNGSTSYTQKTINVPTSGTISDVNITINATHPNLQNLIMAVLRPSGSLSTFFNQQCSGSADMNVTFDSQGSVFTCGSPTTGTYAPTSLNLNTFNGFNQMGDWKFGFKDVVSGADSGTINSISLEVCSQITQLLANSTFEFEDFSLYPNPNNGNFTVQFNSATASKVAIAVYDMSGRIIFNKTYDNSGMFSQNLQLDKVQSGIYLVSITDGANKIVKRIVIE